MSIINSYIQYGILLRKAHLAMLYCQVHNTQKVYVLCNHTSLTFSPPTFFFFWPSSLPPNAAFQSGQFIQVSGFMAPTFSSIYSLPWHPNLYTGYPCFWDHAVTPHSSSFLLLSLSPTQAKSSGADFRPERCPLTFGDCKHSQITTYLGGLSGRIT